MLEKDIKIIWGITGNRKVQDFDALCQKATNLADKARRCHAVLSIGGAYGWDWEVLTRAYDFKVYYILRLPFKSYLEKLGKFIESKLCVSVSWEKKEWEGDQDVTCYHARNGKIVDDILKSPIEHQVLQAYWDRRKYGGTLKTIKRAFSKNVKVFNWFDMKNVTKQMLPKRY